MAILDELKTFAKTYHQYVDACDDLEKKSKRYKQLNETGVDYWYRNSNNEIIVASRQIEGSVAKVKEAVDEAKRQSDKSLRAAQRACNQKDYELYECKKDGREYRKNQRFWCVVSIFVWLFFGLPTSCILEYKGVGVFEDVYNLGFLIVITFFIVKLALNAVEMQKMKTDIKTSNDPVIDAEEQSRRNFDQYAQAMSVQLESLKPQAAQQKDVALQQARLIWANDMVAKGEEIKDCANKCDALYTKLTSLRTIPSERDWPCVDDVIDKIASGRADDLKEALQLIDTDVRHRELMSMQAAQLGEHVKLRKQLREDVRDLGRKVELTRDEIRRQHTADRDQLDRQHAQQMAAEAAQIALQAATYYEQHKFHNEIRRQEQQSQLPTP